MIIVIQPCATKSYLFVYLPYTINNVFITKSVKFLATFSLRFTVAGHINAIKAILRV